MASPVYVECSRTIPVDVERAFDEVLPISLPAVMSRRYAAMPPVKEVRDQDGPWGSVGQTRTIATTDGGSMLETLHTVDRPEKFAYEISEIRGPMRPLVRSLDGAWTFSAAGNGATLVTWSWTLHATSSVTALALPLLARMWRGYARQALEEIEKSLVGS